MSEQVCLITGEVMEQNIFKVVFPQLAWYDLMGVRTGEKKSELHTKITYLWTDLTAIQLVDIVLFSSMKLKGYTDDGEKAGLGFSVY